MEDVKTVHYATKDPIKNLRVRVTLTKVSVQRGPTPPAQSTQPAPPTGQQQEQPNTGLQTASGPSAGSAAGTQPGAAGSGPANGTGSEQNNQAGALRSSRPVGTLSLRSRHGGTPAAAAAAAGPPAAGPAALAAPAGHQPQQQAAAPPPQQPQPQQQAAVSDPFQSAQQQWDGTASRRTSLADGAGRTSLARRAGPLGEANEPFPYGQAQGQLPPPPPVLLPPPPQQQQQPEGATWVQPLSPQGQAPQAAPFQPQPLPGPYQQYAANRPPLMPAAGQWPMPGPQAPYLPQPIMPVGAGPMHASGAWAPGGSMVAPMYGPPPVFGPGMGSMPIQQPMQWGAHVDPTTGLPVAPPVIVPLPTAGGLPPPPGLWGPPALPPQAPPEQQPTHVPGPPQKLQVTRVFCWQEKVHSASEVAAARQQAAAAAQLGLATDTAEDQAAQRAMRGRSRRVMALGSQTADGLKPKSTVSPKAEGSMLFTYVHSDEFAEQQELHKRITTTEAEQSAPLYRRLMASAKLRQEVLNFRTMYLMADLAGEAGPPHSHDVLLVAIKAYPDGSFDMRPGFNRAGKKYRFEDDQGGIYEYSVEDVSAKAEPTLARRTAQLQRQVAARAAELRALSVRTGRFQAPPEDGQGLRLVLLGEIMGCADFEADRLYVEYALKFDPSLWEMATTCWAASEPGVYKGVSAVCRVVRYPADHASSTPERWVGHWSHPLECELLSRGAPPAAAKFPVLLFQVCSLDRRNRFTSQGYTWCSLADSCPGSTTTTLNCWRPLHRLRDKHQEFFIGGSQELQDMAYMERGPLAEALAVQRSLVAAAEQAGQDPAPQAPPRAMNKYGFRTETTGCIKVRLHVITQQCPQDGDEGAGGEEGGLDTAGDQNARGGGKLAAPSVYSQALTGMPALSPGKRTKRELSLAAVVERARGRLREARGGEVVVRPGLVSQAPTIRQHPVDVRCAEGQVAQFKVTATGMEPLQYQWFKDARPLAVATSNTPQLILAEVSPMEAGAYYCQVSNKDGTAASGKAVLKVDKLSRATRAMGPGGHANDETRSLSSHRSYTSFTAGHAAGGMSPPPRSPSPSPGLPSALPSRAPLAGTRMSRLQRHSAAGVAAAAAGYEDPYAGARVPRSSSPVPDAPPQLHMEPALQQRLSARTRAAADAAAGAAQQQGSGSGRLAPPAPAATAAVAGARQPMQPAPSAGAEWSANMSLQPAAPSAWQVSASGPPYPAASAAAAGRVDNSQVEEVMELRPASAGPAGAGAGGAGSGRLSAGGSGRAVRRSSGDAGPGAAWGSGGGASSDTQGAKAVKKNAW